MRKPRRVHQDGIRFQSLRYIDPTLAAYVGEQVIIRYDPRDVTEIRIYHQDRFLCRAVCQELADETVSLKDIMQARRRRKRELEQQITHRKSLIDQLTISTSPVVSAMNKKPPVPELPDQPNPPKLKRYYDE